MKQLKAFLFSAVLIACFARISEATPTQTCQNGLVLNDAAGAWFQGVLISSTCTWTAYTFPATATPLSSSSKVTVLGTPGTDNNVPSEKAVRDALLALGAGVTIPSVTNLISGNGSGNGADSGIAASNVVVKNAANTFGAFAQTFGGNLLFGTDNTFDLGGSIGSRPRNIFAGTSVVATTSFVFSGLGNVSAPADGVALFRNAANTGFTALQLGGSTSSFPEIKRSSAAINFRLADDSADASITAANGTFSGDVNIHGATLHWPTSNATGTLTNDGSGNLTFAFPTLDQNANPAASKTFAMGSNLFTYTFGATTGAAANMLTVQDTASNTGTGYVFTAGTASSSSANPFRVMCGGVQCVDTTASTFLTRFGSATDYVTLGRFASGSFGAIYFSTASPGSTNYSFLGNATDSYFNAPSASGNLHFRVANGSDLFTLTTAAATFFFSKLTISSAGTLAVPQVQGLGTAPTVTATGSGCSNPTVATGSNNLAGSLTSTGTGASCTFVFTWSGSFAYAHQGNVFLVDTTTAANTIKQTTATTTTTTLVGPVTSGDVLTYGVLGY